MNVAGPAQFQTTITGIPLWLLREYVVAVGGRMLDDGSLQGDGWRAHLAQVEDYRIGSLRVGRVSLELFGAPEAVERVRRALEPKLLRAGG